MEFLRYRQLLVASDFVNSVPTEYLKKRVEVLGKEGLRHSEFHQCSPAGNCR
ncbi:hypothetical protein ACTMU2_39120 [Cupriavidus basilensis]